MINAVWARQIVEQLEAGGLDTAALLREVGLERPRLFRTDGRIPYAKHVALLEGAAAVARDDTFGFQFGGTRDLRDAGLLGYVGLSAATFGAGLRNVQRYMRVMSEGVQLTIKPDSTETLVHVDTVDPRFRTSRQLFEFGLALLVRWCRLMTGRTITPVWVGLRHERLTNRDEFRRFFGCPVHFGRGQNVACLSSRDLSLPLATADERLNRLLRTYCEETLARRDQVAVLSQEVERAIAAHLPAGRAQLDTVAAELGMSKRTLSRRLSDEEISFGEIRERLRRDLALRYLEDPTLNLAQIAYLLGYSEVSAFNHAFRRWTGSTPSVFRARAA